MGRAFGFFFLTMVGFIQFALAEYRAFLLEIKNSAGLSRQVTSTLDDLQYPEYYPLRVDEHLAVLDSWMCWERSDHFTATCPPPPRPMAISNPASTDEKARNPAQTEQKPENSGN